jgi:hypothetical protein
MTATTSLATNGPFRPLQSLYSEEQGCYHKFGGSFVHSVPAGLLQKSARKPMPAIFASLK